MTFTEKKPSSNKGKLSIVATPIGNLSDITFRAVETLKSANVILAEDTRRTKVLAHHYGITTQIQSFHSYSSEASRRKILDALLSGNHFALVSDAGTPLLSDPGKELVREALDAGIVVESLPGPSAVTTALTMSGLIFQSFRFVGFLPRTGKKRQEALDAILCSIDASVFFESPKRLLKTLNDLSTVISSDREIAVCREMTKLHEEAIRGTTREVIEQLRENVRGEITVVVSGKALEDRKTADIKNLPNAFYEQLEELEKKGMMPKELAKELAGQFHITNGAAYQAILKTRKK